SLDNDADHILAWADGGGTGVANLGQPCPKHHRLKHCTAWQPVGATRATPPGWTSPMGRIYKAEYQDWEPPTWPELLNGQDRREPPPGQGWQDLPGPPLNDDCPMPPNRPDASEPPDDLDDVESPMDIAGVDPPLPADPWPYWSSIAA
ncbi:HNH endonuclease signature motif containing protein, partial [Arthrobacter sp. NPDC057013]|uniref:HNH endonuclease signature motif containing protein n=1 Tax=Arthrobacter sp. NPDC057013 TaxID=3345999 RepID=UPI00363A63CB